MPEQWGPHREQAEGHAANKQRAKMRTCRGQCREQAKGPCCCCAALHPRATHLARLFSVASWVEGRFSQQNTVLLSVDVQLPELLFAVQVAVMGRANVSRWDREMSSLSQADFFENSNNRHAEGELTSASSQQKAKSRDSTALRVGGWQDVLPQILHVVPVFNDAEKDRVADLEQSTVLRTL